MRQTIICALVMIALGVGLSHAAIPQKMNYQGKLTGTDGKLVTDGSYEMIFSLHDAESGGTEEWSEAWEGEGSVAVAGGLFNVSLGAHTPVSIPFDENYWIQVKVKYGGSYETLLPRQQVASAGYAFRAERVTDGAITAASLGDGAVTAAKIADGSITDADLSGSAAVSWSKVSKASSSIADLGTRSAADLTSGSLAAARLPSGGEWALSSALGITGANVGIGTADPGTARLAVTGDAAIDGNIGLTGTLGGYYAYDDANYYRSDIINEYWEDVHEYNTGISFTVPTGKTWYYLITADYDFYYLYSERHTGYTGFYAYWAFKVRNGSKGTELASIPFTGGGYRLDWGYCGASNYFHWFPSVSRVLSLSAGTYNIYITPSGYADSTMDYANCSAMHFRMKRIP